MAGGPSRRAYAWVAIGLLGFAIYVSLLPFRFEPVAPRAAWHAFVGGMTAWPTPLPRANFLANLLLFVPIGFGLAGTGLAYRPHSVLRTVSIAVGTLSVSIAVSVTAEFLQVFAPGRVVAAADVVAQTLGCALGLALWAACGQALTSWLRESRAPTHDDRLTRALVGYAVLWAFANLAPFDITLDPEALAARWRDGAIAMAPLHQAFSPLFWWHLAIAAIAAVPLGMLAVSGWWTQASRRDPLTAITFGVAGVVTMEAAQVFIRSHAALTTDALGAAVGIAAGVGAGARLWRAPATTSHHVPGTGTASTALALWCLVIAAYHWQPFDFVVDTDAIRQKAVHLSLVPLAGYGAGSDLSALNNVVAKAATALPLGLIAAFALPARMDTRLAIPLWTACASLIFGIVEIGQFFVPSRVPDPTDVLIGVVASLGGLALGRWLRAGYTASGATTPGRRTGG